MKTTLNKMNLHEKITIKGHLAKQGVAGHRLVRLTAKSACDLHYVCYGVPVAFFLAHGPHKQWRHRKIYRGPSTSKSAP